MTPRSVFHYASKPFDRFYGSESDDEPADEKVTSSSLRGRDIADESPGYEDRDHNPSSKTNHLPAPSRYKNLSMKHSSTRTSSRSDQYSRTKDAAYPDDSECDISQDGSRRGSNIGNDLDEMTLDDVPRGRSGKKGDLESSVDYDTDDTIERIKGSPAPHVRDISPPYEAIEREPDKYERFRNDGYSSPKTSKCAADREKLKATYYKGSKVRMLSPSSARQLKCEEMAERIGHPSFEDYKALAYGKHDETEAVHRKPRDISPCSTSRSGSYTDDHAETLQERRERKGREATDEAQRDLETKGHRERPQRTRDSGYYNSNYYKQTRRYHDEDPTEYERE